MDTWYQYRLVWAEHWWVALILIVGVLLIAGSIVGMVTASPASVIFIPGLAAVYVHHLVVQRAADQR